MSIHFSRRDFLLSLALLVILAATRGHHFATAQFLPNATIAVFFVAGAAIESVLALPLFLLAALGVDYAAITWGGVSSFCVTPAYSCLIPAYGSVWLIARRFAAHRGEWTPAPRSWGRDWALPGLAASLVSELFSSGGYYLFSGRFPHPGFVEFGQRLAAYYPKTLLGDILWLAIGFGLLFAWDRGEREAVRR